MKIAYLPEEFWPKGTKEEILEAVKTHPKRKEYTIPEFVEAFNRGIVNTSSAYCAFVDETNDTKEMLRLERLKEINEAILHFKDKKKDKEESLNGMIATFPKLKKKIEHDIEIADMAIARLRKMYSKELNR